jgi:tetratricopeptide (TPR) repeat protein
MNAGGKKSWRPCAAGQEGLEGQLSQFNQNLRDNQNSSLDTSAQDAAREAERLSLQREEEERRRREEQQRLMAQMDQEARERQEKLNQGVEAMYREDFDGAKDTFQELIDEAPDMAEAYARMGEAYFLERKEDPENRRIAVENLNRAIEKDASSYWPHLILGDIYQEAKNYDDALEEYEKADQSQSGERPYPLRAGEDVLPGPEVPALGRRLPSGDQHRARPLRGLL